MLESLPGLLSFLLAIGVVLLLPGAAWLIWIGCPDQTDIMCVIADCTALSLALTALVGELCFLLGIQFTGLGVAALYVLLAFIAAAGLWRRQVRLKLTPFHLLALAVVLGLIVWRLYQARTLALPAWVDSVHHTLLVRIIQEQGGLPLTWQPYLDVPFYYHYGFHISTALFGFIANLPPAQAVLLMGQVINAAVALAVYRLSKAVWGSTPRALAAMLLVGFAFHMPAYYLTWGRYTLLTGLTVLPVAMAWLLDAERKHNRWLLATLVVLTVGVALNHYLALGLMGLFTAVAAAFTAWGWLRSRRTEPLHWQPYAATALGVLLALPWLLRVLYFDSQSLLVEVSLEGSPDYVQYLLYLAGPDRNYWLLGLAGIGLIFALLRPAGRRLAVWSLLVLFLALPWGLRINPFRPDHLVIILFMPAALLLAHLLAGAAEGLARWKPRLTRWGWAGVGVVLMGVLVWGAWETRSIIRPETVIALPEDAAALDWVQSNTAQEARFFINAAVWQYGVYRGVDGGYWLMPVTGRFSLVPPAAYGWGDARQYSVWGERASRISGCGEEFWALVQDARLDYVYLRQGVGSLQPAGLQGCADVVRVYSQDGVSIFRIER